ncbi:hypothetical protein ASPACDRAFT_121829 [Aspergillus aculeatus ATCC 16872]|uniref:Transcription factor domain-containing protein n=1 Tax=Aspergillus aculeatus (strain ATCC 16872 / CBS 172.66 / WB 5094) TaxID=690307 RepID=A0A1L9WS19_ASPA1|nr:uncharacterized protein ASPACDRAFT_121829 [Aspergillus aculeatus ATCC 16872]OJJ99039.1 hypothetical protein ASPACDRAFT_121829 [Aspergillus aculeatus ATCC 16872]
MCRQCQAYGVCCSFSFTQSKTQPLQPVIEHVLAPPRPSAGLPYWVRPTDRLITRFQLQIAATMSYGKRLDVYRTQVVELAQTTPFLEHAITTVALMYQRHTTTPFRLTPDWAESYHWDRALVGFNRKLASNPQSDDKAALLSTSMLLWLLVFCHVDASSPEEAWPLYPNLVSGPTWLRIARGKDEVWRQMPSPPQDRISAALAPVENNPIMNRPAPSPAPLQGVPASFLRLFDLDSGKQSLDSGRVYHSIAVDVAWALFGDRPLLPTVLSFVTFLSTMSPNFKSLLLARDPRALLLLACWYGKIRGLGVWWMTPRTVLEGESICRYLERGYPDNLDLQKMLVLLRAL